MTLNRYDKEKDWLFIEQFVYDVPNDIKEFFEETGIDTDFYYKYSDAKSDSKTPVLLIKKASEYFIPSILDNTDTLHINSMALEYHEKNYDLKPYLLWIYFTYAVADGEQTHSEAVIDTEWAKWEMEKHEL